MIIPMKRVRIAAPHGRADELIGLLDRLGLFHIIDPGQDPVFMFEEMPVGFLSRDKAITLAQAETMIASISVALNSLPARPRGRALPAPMEDWPGPDGQSRLAGVVERIANTAAGLEKARAERKENQVYRDVFMEFSGLIEVVASSTDVDLVGVSFPQEGARAMEELERALDQATGGVYTMFQPRERKQTAIALVVIPISMRDAVSEKVFARKIHPIHLPERFSKGTFAATIAALLERETELAVNIRRLELELGELSDQWLERLKMAKEKLARSIAPLRAQEKLAHSERVFWISGWAPEAQMERLARELESQLGPEALIYGATPPIGQWEHVPVLLHNRRWARPFERVVDLYSPPVYGSVDPTAFLAVTFPLFFGMIMGDVGHAMLLGLVGMAVARIPGGGAMAADGSSILYRMAAVSALFGLVYGEFFGDLWGKLGLYEPLFDRKHGAGSMLAVVIFIGFFHVAAGAALGVVNNWRKRAWREGMEKVADILLLISLFWFGAQASQGPVSSQAGWALAAALFIKLAAGWSLKSALEAPKLISNVLSYSRLMALGLASVAMADLANGLITGPGWWFGGIVTGVAFHILNFVIGVVSPAIQTSRLHYVEFFSQFFEPAGRRYKPLAGSGQ